MLIPRVVVALAAAVLPAVGFSPVLPRPAHRATLHSRHEGLAAASYEQNDRPPVAEAEVEFAPALTGPERVVRALTFYSRVIPVLAAYKAQEVAFDVQRQVFKTEVSQEEEERRWNSIDEWGSTRIAETIKDLRGFYVKTGQVISTRVDLFPEAYTSKLAELQDSLEPMSFDIVEAMVRQELLEGEPLSSLFQVFDPEPLGAASIAQVHRAVLLDGRQVAVKVQRPNVVPMLLGDISNLKSFSKKLRDALPVDYYTVFSELGRALEYELDFLHEAQAAEKIWAAVTHTTDGRPTTAPLRIPRAISGLVSKRVFVMEYIEGTPLSKLRDEMANRGIEAGSPESALVGKKLLKALTDAYARMIFGSGYIHGDPHPGNVFIMPGAEIALIDCGQVKQIPSSFRVKLAEAVLLVGDYLKAAKNGDNARCQELVSPLADAVRSFGVTFAEDIPDEDSCAAAVALLLFGTPEYPLPGGYSHKELSQTSPIKQVASFPQELVMLGRSTVLIKGIASRLGIPWSLADKWGGACRAAVGAPARMPVWATAQTTAISTSPSAEPPVTGNSAPAAASTPDSSRTRFREVKGALRQTTGILNRWALDRGKLAATSVYSRIPERFQSRVKGYIIEREVRKLDAQSE